MVNEAIRQLAPTALWQQFADISNTPRRSKHEEKIQSFVINFAEQHQLDVERDALGNVLICKPATAGMEHKAPLALQAHLDMVCEKHSHVTHDFDNDPIQTVIESGWVKASGTTLGADNGIAAAAMLAVLAADDIEHGPLECLFTADEETGMTGANGLPANWLKAPVMLNLDTEEEGEFYIGCAGGLDTNIAFTYQTEAAPTEHVGVRVSVSGLKGGHSGCDIHDNRANALKLMTRLLLATGDVAPVRISSFQGGNLRNAIPREAVVQMMVPIDALENVYSSLLQTTETLRREWRVGEPKLTIQVEDVDTAEVMDADTQRRLLLALQAAAHGVVSWSTDIDGVVDTSTNLASIKMVEGEIKIATSQRSFRDSAKRDIATTVASVFQLAGADVSHNQGYPGWEPDPESEVLRAAQACHEQLFGQEAKVMIIHAGLECGIIRKHYPQMEIVSCGPTIRNAHSPDEKVEIASVESFWRLLLALLKAL